jgi:gliding motility associated protien GldN
MRNLILFLTKVFFFVLCVNFVNAQGVLDGIYVKEHVPSRKPIPYNYLREADMMWTKKIWRMLDLREKQNFPLYYPTKPLDDRYSLIDLIIAGATKGYDLNENGTGAHLVLYKAPLEVQQSEFLTSLGINVLGLADSSTLKTYLDDQFGVKKIKTPKIDIVTGQPTGDSTEFTTSMSTSEVLRYIMKEEWYFDKQRSKMEVRIIGLCPIRIYKDKNATTTPSSSGGASNTAADDEEIKKTKICWVYFPALRPLLANHEVFNPNNDSERRTFDDIFFKRKFSSFIIQETNVYDNRGIGEYSFGIDAQLEAEKVKDFIFKLEHDLWEF